MRSAINESRLMAANLTLNKYFGSHIWQVYPVLEECEKTKEYSRLRSLSAFATFYFGQRIHEKNASVLEDDVYFVFEAYKTILTMDKEADEIEAINAAIDGYHVSEAECMLRFHKEDILKIKD